MPYNTRRKSLSLPSLGIHVPTSNAARASMSSSTKSSSRPSTSSTSPSSRPSISQPDTPDSPPSKRIKRSHDEDSVAVVDTTPPASPTPATSVEMADPEPVRRKVDLEGINDDIVEAVITQLQNTDNQPHLIKDLALMLALTLRSVQNSANPCAIISSRLASYMKRPCWTALAPCPLAKELETVHPRRTYYFLTTLPRQPLPESGVIPPAVTLASAVADLTPSVSLTDDSGSDSYEDRRRQLSPSPELDLPYCDFDLLDDMPDTPMGSLPKPASPPRDLRSLPHDLPPLEKDEREFTQTADTLLKRKFNEPPSTSQELATAEYGYRDELWFGDSNTTAFLTSPAMRPSAGSSSRKDEEADNWLRMHKLFELDQTAGAESIEIDELDGLLEGC
ncbi:uncharacterized protein F5Z01DRAFT_654625 [Emericellopsis atlantica]|uniref:GDS1 winged helix domain-containing protein n=1 Tax=Emericellopsis atlantica TaxID=2614577 RepID=A0A9P7ZNA7_9HYPO|nr:uncharacterized protein F5Z01DRAFT_654625 [Emericellopsis atlantica]KAG9254705.1 hypothetical protein F5Z01DRAFT_654625 [Emericellopsis atlantica]